MYYIINRVTKERMYQYNATYYYDVAIRMLKDARDKYPGSNPCIEYDGRRFHIEEEGCDD